MDNATTQAETAPTIKRGDLYSQVTNTIIQQLETGTVPWIKPWQGDVSANLAMPLNCTTGNQYQGINIVLLWTAATNKQLGSHEWASFKQWQANKEMIRKGEKGTTIVYYDTLKKEIEGEVKKIPFLKSSVVFNRAQLQSWQPKTIVPQPFNDWIPRADDFIINTEADIEHEDYGACYLPVLDKIYMPYPEFFIDTETRTRQQAYYGVLWHELIHWTGHPKRLDRAKGRKFGDQTYAAEELIAELGAAFLCAELEITSVPKVDHASYIANWISVLKENKTFIVKAASEASKAVRYLKELQPKN